MGQPQQGVGAGNAQKLAWLAVGKKNPDKPQELALYMYKSKGEYERVGYVCGTITDVQLVKEPARDNHKEKTIWRIFFTTNNPELPVYVLKLNAKSGIARNFWNTMLSAVKSGRVLPGVFKVDMYPGKKEGSLGLTITEDDKKLGWHFKWDYEAGTFDGTPAPLPVTIDGEEYKDFSAATEFWRVIVEEEIKPWLLGSTEEEEEEEDDFPEEEEGSEEQYGAEEYDDDLPF